MVAEDLAAEVTDPSARRLTPAHRAAVRLADAMMTRPDSLGDDDVAALRGAFSTSELIELTIDVMKWNAQKASVALGVDAEVRSGQLVDLLFDDDGNWVRPDR